MSNHTEQRQALIVGRDSMNNVKGIVIAWVDSYEAARAAVAALDATGCCGATCRSEEVIRTYMDAGYVFAHPSLRPAA